MAKLVKYDNTGVEESSGGTGVKVRPGVKVAKIERCQQRDTKKDGSPANDLELALNVGEEFDWVFTYIGLDEPSAWKLAEFTRALGLKESGGFDPDKQVGKFLRVKINPDSYNDEYSPRAGRLMKAQPGDEDLFAEGNTGVSEASSNGDGPEDKGDQEATASANGAGAGQYENPDFVASREGEEGIGSYEDWPEEDLLAECEDRGVTLPGGRGSKKNKAIQALRDEDQEVAGGGEEPEASANGDGDDYDDWGMNQLKAEWEAREMGDLPTIRGRNAEARIQIAMVEALREDDASNPFEA